jgi:superfamily II RNA helicase
MVKICPTNYPAENEKMYSEHFEKYPFPLSSFQKYAIESIVEGQHILVTAHTGSGKTLPAEFAIEHFKSIGKKVIYTSPIKALSNQKFYEFTLKFPHISFGILTGDIKSNPEADVLIMTTEILLNTLYAKLRKTQTTGIAYFEMDFENELGCVIFDEIHYINDLDRGKVWEETIIMLPRHIQMVMLSATLDSPEKFAAWCETRGCASSVNDKMVYLTTTYERVVPLTHYSFITCTQGLFKVLKDKEMEKEIMKITNKLHVIQNSKSQFSDDNYQTIHKTLRLFQDKNHFVKRQHVLNSVSKYMVEHSMLPAICFVLSRKALEQCAHEITTPLLEDDSKVPYIVRRECEQIIRKLPNFQEYIHLPEYNSMVSLLEKGIAIHHAGVMPILREMVEMLFAKGYIKLLFATETFAVGINMPTKTVLFTDVNKFDGNGMRPLMSHEYTQMAGRAGRRGIDTVGHVIHLNNLFKDATSLSMKTMMKGKPQKLVSKFKISFNLILNLIDIGETDYTAYVSKSMSQETNDEIIEQTSQELAKLRQNMDDLVRSISECHIHLEDVKEYIKLNESRHLCVNKRRKEVDKKIQLLESTHRNIKNDEKVVAKYIDIEKQIICNEECINGIRSKNITSVKNVMNFLEKRCFILNTDNGYELTNKGLIATHLKEVHCLVFGELLSMKIFNGDYINSKELAALFSCFTNISVAEEKRTFFIDHNIEWAKNCIININNLYQIYKDDENKYMLDTGTDYNIHFDIFDYVLRWCDCETEMDCKLVLQELIDEKEIFLGEFVKALLKINNIAAEMEKVAELTSDLELLSMLREIPKHTLKYVATNQSLYV